MLSYLTKVLASFMEKTMEKKERIENFQKWINDGNEITVEDMLAIVAGCMHNAGKKEFSTFLMLEGQIYDINVKARGFRNA